jgi:16S rRNA (uracil1498-N3)-methyltransferase
MPEAESGREPASGATAPRDPDGSGGPHAFVASLGAPELGDADRHHLERVVRLRPGDPLTVGDGAGRWRPVRFGAELEPAGAIVTVPRPTPTLSVGFALDKGERPEWVTQKLTELGIDVIVPFVAARSVVRWDARKAAANHERLVRIAREASMQCRRAWLPTVEPLTTFADLVARAGVVLAQGGGPPLTGDARVVLVGPEGGWSPDELAAAPATAGLGVHVLRAETAVVAAGTLLAAGRAGLR